MPVPRRLANTGSALLSTDVQVVPPSRLTSRFPGHFVCEPLARQVSSTAMPRSADTNWISFTAAGSVVTLRQLRPPSAVPISSRPHDGLRTLAGQVIRAHACAGSGALIDSGAPGPSHCTCHVAPAVAVAVCHTSVRAGMSPVAPISQPAAGAGKARAVNVGAVVPRAPGWAGDGATALECFRNDT
jgi:hypothetical protein